MKKLIALLLCGMVSMSALTGCGDSEGMTPVNSQESEVESQENSGTEETVQGDESADEAYEETVSFTLTSYFSNYQMSSGIDYTQDSLYQYIIDKFNIEPELWACEISGASEKMQMWVNNGTMPDSMFNVFFEPMSYYQYVEQGLLRALPDGWETRWPNIAHIVEVSGLADLLKVDGKTYAIPHSVYGMYTNVGAYIYDTMWFRKDYAEQVGLSDFGSDNVVTLSEAKEYLEKVRDAGLAPIVLEGGDFFVQRGFCSIYGLPECWTTVVETEDGFVFTPEMDEYTDMLTELQAWYKDGLIDPDYYNKSQTDSVNSFTAGQAAALYYAGTPGDISYIRGQYESQTGEDGRENLGVVIVTADDGSLAIQKNYNYWGGTMFSLNTDDKTLERILDLTDWLCSEEGNTSLQLGVPGVDWDYDASGNIYMTEANPGDRDVLTSPFFMLGWCPDEFGYTGLSTTANAQDVADAVALLEVAEKATKFYDVSDNYTMFTGESKSNYSFPTTGKWKEIMCSDVDVESAWDDHIKEYRNLWEPLINDLNQTYGY